MQVVSSPSSGLCSGAQVQVGGQVLHKLQVGGQVQVQVPVLVVKCKCCCTITWSVGQVQVQALVNERKC